MDPILSHVRARQDDVLALIRRMVECESPSDDRAAVNRFGDLLAEEAKRLADVRRVPSGRYGDHLLFTFRQAGSTEAGQLLALGHSDTVWPRGTLASMPFRESDGRLWGPGVLDMKAGLAFFLMAMRTLQELDVPVRRPVALLVNADEEVGSPSSRALTEEQARRSAAVLVLEPGTGLKGKLKTARKGVGGYLIRVRGRAAHAGVDFTQGDSAIVELMRQLHRVVEFTDLERGLTVNPGVIAGGTRSNVIAAEAWAEVDIRVEQLADAAPLEQQFLSLRPFNPRCQVEVTGGLNRPPMERTAQVGDLFNLARTLARDLDIDLEESSTGGGSDGNFTAALGVPTLDGLGAVGEGAHAANESVLVDRIPDRIALLAKLASAL